MPVELDNLLKLYDIYIMQIRMKSSEVRADWARILEYAQEGHTVVVEHYNKPVVTIQAVTDQYTVRNVISTVSTVDVPEEYAKQVRSILDTTEPVRQASRSVPFEDGDPIELSARLFTYRLDGNRYWTVEWFDAQTTEVEEYSDRKPAEARFEGALKELRLEEAGI